MRLEGTKNFSETLISYSKKSGLGLVLGALLKKHDSRSQLNVDHRSFDMAERKRRNREETEKNSQIVKQESWGKGRKNGRNGKRP